MRNNLRLLCVALCLVQLVFGQNPASIDLNVVFRDFTPAHPDFEHYTGNGVTGAVESTLDNDGKPVLRGSPPYFTGAAYFAQWYRDTAGVNTHIEHTLTLAETAPNSGVYTYDSGSNGFFPLDDQGFGNYPGWPHNFHFTSELKTTFTYQGNEVFTFSGDDDLWVFINNKLALDLGGVHPPQQATITLSQMEAYLGISAGNDYELAIFHAERHTDGSNYRITTTLQLKPTDPGPTDPGHEARICGVAYQGFCAGVPVSQCEIPYFNFGSDAFHFSNWHVVAMKDFNGNVNGGDTEGRIAVGRNFDSKGGWSTGFKVVTLGSSASDVHVPYSFIAGNNANYVRGEILPDGNNRPYLATKEDAFAGSSFTVAADQQNSQLPGRRTGSCPAAGCLDSSFTTASAYYKKLAAAFSAIPDNVALTINFGNADLACSSNTATQYKVSVTPAQLASIQSWNNPTGCNTVSGVSWIFDITGTADVVFKQGADLNPGTQSGTPFGFILWNVVGARAVKTNGGSPFGNLLAPEGSVDMRAPGNPNPIGAWNGITIADTYVAVNQINKPNCPVSAPPPNPPPSTPLCPWFESQCDGLMFPLGQKVVSFRDYQVVSFADFNSFGADVEGRIACQKNFKVNGYSIGLELQTTVYENSVDFALVVGRDATFYNGQVHPDGTGRPYPGAQEFIFVGGNFNASADLLALQRGTCNVPGCLDSSFNSAKSCYVKYSNDLAAAAPNAVADILYNGLHIVCNSPDDLRYTVNINPSVFNSISYYWTENCNIQAQWVLNILGTNDFTIAGDNFPANPGAVLINVLGAGRTMTIANTVFGSILAPNNNIYAESGLVVGKIVAGNIQRIHQVNIVHCPTPDDIVLKIPSKQSPAGTTIYLYSSGDVRVDDSVNINGVNSKVTSVDFETNSIEVNPSHNGVGANQVLDFTVSDPRASRRLPDAAATGTATQDENTTDAANVVAPTLAMLFALLFLFF